jgi:tetratricopeptide (TPR) repeat protein
MSPPTPPNEDRRADFRLLPLRRGLRAEECASGATCQNRVRMHRRACLLLLPLAVTLAASCRRQTISDDAYREVVTAFYTSLAALQTSQDVLARRGLDRVIALAPQEPAGHANLGLLLLRQQQLDEAIGRLTKASELAPGNASIERLRALAESRKGNLEQSIRHWRRAIELDSADVRAPFQLAQDLERQGGTASEAEAQRILETVATRSGNLAAVLEFARLAARRSDSAALLKAIDLLTRQSGSWPADAQARFQAVRQAADRGPSDAATAVVFLKNTLIRSPEYQAAYSAVMTPRSEVGEPLVRFATIRNPEPQPAPADDRLSFQMEPQLLVTSAGAAWAGAVWLTGEGSPTIVAAGAREVRLATGVTLPFPAGVPSAPPGQFGVAAADLNYDFRADFVLAGGGGLKMFQQDSSGGFTDVTPAAKIPGDLAAAPMHGAWVADVDTDGDLDLVLARQEDAPAVFRNNGDGTFAVRQPFGGVSRLRDFVWADLDGEGVPDAVLLDDQGAVRVFLNLRGGEFRERPVPSSFGKLAAIAAAEATGDTVLDLLGVTPAGVIIRLSKSNGSDWNAAELARAEPPAGLAVSTGRLLVADLDNNGASDLIVAGRSASRVLLGDGRGYAPVKESLALGVTAAADLDGNGRLDLIGAAGDGARLARSHGRQTYHWQAIRPRARTATGDQRINSFGIGGEVEIRTGLHAQKQVIAAPVVHFGLGQATIAEVARITWPNGVLQSEFDLGADTAVSAGQRLKGSCPWVFAWNGREMGFVTDFIWRSPLGLRINAQATADVLMTEDWVKLRNDQLAAKDGFYDLRITAELWETHFFDLVSLLVVDHPQGTEVFVDERFSVPPPRPAVIATSPVQVFASVRDDQGHDVGEAVRARDDRHLDFAGRGRYQGVTRNHHVEIALPEEAPRNGPLWLVAQGWIHPTDSSINVALSQGAHAPPVGLSLHVADARGRFKEARTGLGFPAGKDKTILIDLAGLFPSGGPRRFRLRTNLEIFWDRLGWAAGRPDVKLEPRRIELSSADLVYRGFSVTQQKDASTPERAWYVLEGTAARWRDLEGFHTRFGDVRELLLAVDDRYVIMNAGDELRVRFREVRPPAPGMTRDFVLVGDGWEKDGDYNTTASRTVLPLPTHRSGPYGGDTERLEDDPVFLRNQADWERYHTRYVSPAAVRDALRIGRIDRYHP